MRNGLLGKSEAYIIALINWVAKITVDKGEKKEAFFSISFFSGKANTVYITWFICYKLFSQLEIMHQNRVSSLILFPNF